MDDAQAKQLVQETFRTDFDAERFEHFARSYSMVSKLRENDQSYGKSMMRYRPL